MPTLPDRGRKFRNKLLARLPDGDVRALGHYLEPVPLKFRQRLETCGRRISDLYFVEDGLVSVVGLSQRRREQVEVAIVGNEGFTGCATLLAVDRSPHDALVQVAGSALRIGVDDFKQVLAANPALRPFFSRYLHVSGVQVLHTVIASTRGTIEERLSRWLLMAQDRLDTDIIHLTHELLSITLSVRRAGVTMALGRLGTLGLISYRRGAIRILDRERLLQHAGDFYGEPEAEYERVFATSDDDREQTSSAL